MFEEIENRDISEECNKIKALKDFPFDFILAMKTSKIIKNKGRLFESFNKLKNVFIKRLSFGFEYVETEFSQQISQFGLVSETALANTSTTERDNRRRGRGQGRGTGQDQPRKQRRGRRRERIDENTAEIDRVFFDMIFLLRF